MTRRCPRCRREVPVERWRRRPDGRWRSECNECHNRANREWRAAHREGYAAHRRERYAALRAAGMTVAEASALR